MFKVNTGADFPTIYTETVLQTLVSLLHFGLFTELLNGYLQVFVSKKQSNDKHQLYDGKWTPLIRRFSTLSDKCFTIFASHSWRTHRNRPLLIM